ncbi:MAG: hypothetical protein Q9172_001371 [Xanthocarpia lactea]
MVGLKINSAPFRPSLLRNHYTPRSPVSPLESVAKRVCSSLGISSGNNVSSFSSSTVSPSNSPPPSPYKWLWQCHECHTSYQIGTTRRCLLDDHELCYGQPTKKRSKKGKKKTRACQSQFDYTGWQAWGAWKRSGQEEQENKNIERDCGAFCDWPSQCRWSRVQEKTVEQTDVSEAVSPEPEMAAISTDAEAATQPSKSADSLVSRISNATQKLTVQWTSMLSPIEEEPQLPDMTAIEDFLNSAKTTTQPRTASCYNDISAPSDTPFIAPLKVIKASGTSPLSTVVHPTCPKADSKSSLFGLDLGFDFGFLQKPEEEAVKPSLATGLKNLVAGTVGIALSTPSRCRRCVSDPPTQSAPLQEQLQGARRLSVG